ncbi:hypothetical protein ACSYAY_03720 [Leptospirillum ferriphilum]|jgi:hypothetical protein|uniref:Uncharacterized protein n=2 Tax=Leptospirillum TaxID=179 RepID=A0A094X871_9BACT|nr:hypothetical protein [Leptospirillum ferriphilum]EDZ39973.1 MAG: Protein of unknown function [Leptospirillum sp. Group II '5-way CG']KGA94739.1 hypothetical protein LptCag_2169 [Leptospirillum ferriphilum]
MYYSGVRIQENHIELTIINEGESIILHTTIPNERNEILRIFENRPKTRVLLQHSKNNQPIENTMDSLHHEWKTLPLSEMETSRKQFSEHIPHLNDTHQIARLALFHWKSMTPNELVEGDFLHELAVGLDENEE